MSTAEEEAGYVLCVSPEGELLGLPHSVQQKQMPAQGLSVQELIANK